MIPIDRSNSRTKSWKLVSQSRRATSSRVAGMLGGGAARLLGGLGDDDEDRVALAELALLDDPDEPLPVVADGTEGDARRSAPADPPRLRHPFDEAPGLRLGEGQARGPVAQPERLADLALGQRRLVGEQVAVDAGDRRRDAPGGAHLAPGVGQLAADRLGTLRGRAGGHALAAPIRAVGGRRWSRQRTSWHSPNHRAASRARLVRAVNVRLDSSRY